MHVTPDSWPAPTDPSLTRADVDAAFDTPAADTVDGDREATLWQVVAQRDALTAQVATLQADAETARRVLLNTIRERDQFAAEIHDLVDQVAALTAERDAALRKATSAWNLADTLGFEGMTTARELARQRDQAVAERDAMRPVFDEAVALVDGWATRESVDGHRLRAAVERYRDSAVTPEAPIHRYYSTACHHDLHKECQTDATRWDGTHKIAGTCKWCQAPCVCPCHTGPAAAEPVAHELEIVPRPKMDADGLVAARCSCGEYESSAGTEATVTKDWRQHAAAKTAAAVVSGFVERARAAPLSSPEPAPQPPTEARPPATGGIVEPGTWLIGEPRDVPSLKLSWGEAAAVARDGLLDMEARRTALAAREAGGHPVAMTDLTDDERAAYAEAAGLGDTGRTGALEAAIEAASFALFHDMDLWPSFTERAQHLGGPAAARSRTADVAVRAAAPLIEREALERAADRFDALADQDDGYGPYYYVACLLREWAASLVVTGEGEDRG